jgi:hypothetical protein
MRPCLKFCSVLTQSLPRLLVYRQASLRRLAVALVAVLHLLTLLGRSESPPLGPSARHSARACLLSAFRPNLCCLAACGHPCPGRVRRWRCLGRSSWGQARCAGQHLARSW